MENFSVHFNKLRAVILLTALESSLPATILSVSNALIVPVVLLPNLLGLKLDGIWMNTPIKGTFRFCM